MSKAEGKLPAACSAKITGDHHQGTNQNSPRGPGGPFAGLEVIDGEWGPEGWFIQGDRKLLRCWW